VGAANEVKGVGAVSNGAMSLSTLNPNIKTLTDFTKKDRIAIPNVRLSFNAMMRKMTAEQLLNDPHRLDHLTVALGHPDAVAPIWALWQGHRDGTYHCAALYGSRLEGCQAHTWSPTAARYLVGR
jgi:NitT/TauT family transport system substrate-binding protein